MEHENSLLVKLLLFLAIKMITVVIRDPNIVNHFKLPISELYFERKVLS